MTQNLVVGVFVLFTLSVSANSTLDLQQAGSAGGLSSVGGLLLNFDNGSTALPSSEATTIVSKSKVDVLSEVFKRNIEKLKTKNTKLDIVFLIDGSSSVGKVNFEAELKFVKKILSDFLVSYE